MDSKKHTANLKKKLTKYFAEWCKLPAVIANLHTKPPQLFQDYVDGTDDSALLASRSDKVSSWYLGNYCADILSGEISANTALTMCARYSGATVKFKEALANADQGGLLLPQNAALAMSLSVIAGWKEESDSLFRAFYRGLDTRLLDLRVSEKHDAGSLFRHFWFLLHLYCDVRGLALDAAKYSYPPDMSPYSAVLADWRTTDLGKVQGFVSSMSDFHLQEARTTAHDEIAEFDTEDRMLFPYEILCWLRMREWVGLSNPDHFDHPLMNQPLAKMPGPAPLPYPDTPLLDAVVLKFQEEYPDSFKA